MHEKNLSVIESNTTWIPFNVLSKTSIYIQVLNYINVNNNKMAMKKFEVKYNYQNLFNLFILKEQSFNNKEHH